MVLRKDIVFAEFEMDIGHLHAGDAGFGGGDNLFGGIDHIKKPGSVYGVSVHVIEGDHPRTGVKRRHAFQQLLRFAGGTQAALVVTIMLIAGVLSAFMNNVAVAALMLPVVMDIARKTNRSPSILLMPLAYGALMGGLTTMIGTPPNILVSEALRESGIETFTLFDFSPVGVAAMAGGILFVVLFGIRLLPKDRPADQHAVDGQDLRSQYRLQENLFQIKIFKGSALVGKTLAKSRLGAALGLNVIGITRGGITMLAPSHHEVIQADDLMIVEGNRGQIQEMNNWGQLLTDSGMIGMEVFKILFGSTPSAASSRSVTYSMMVLLDMPITMPLMSDGEANFVAGDDSTRNNG